MLNEEIKQVADAADMIVRGYAFTKDGNLIRILNINDGSSAMVMTMDGTMLETNMDEMEQALVESIWHHDSKYLEE